ncbi:MAG: 50S ribosomal protein L30e [Thermoplasmata archaeon]|nr:50S ribosomal protein L30e [Thermoplasmata archaeon]
MEKDALAKELKRILSSGKVYFGVKQAKKALERKEAKLVIYANNCPEKSEIEKWKIPKLAFEGDSVELGAYCGKPFSVSVLTVVDEGESKILKMVK